MILIEKCSDFESLQDSGSHGSHKKNFKILSEMDCFQYNLAEMFLYLECVWGGVLSHPLLLRFGPCGMYQISIAYSDEHNAY